MTRTAIAVALLLSLLVGVPAQGAQQPDGPATTPDDVKAAFERKDYKETLRLLGRVLSLRGKAAEGIDRYEMLLLRAESNLHLKATTNAVQALEEAAKIAPDDKAAAKARGTVTLIKRSRNLQYTPKALPGGGARAGGGDGKTAAGDADAKAKGPFDITDPDQRQDALKTLYLEEKTAARLKVLEAEKAKTLQPIAVALKVVIPLKDLELAATDHDAETAETINRITDRAHKLMARELDDMTKRTERIAERAKELYEYSTPSLDGGTRIRTAMRGLQQKDVKELKTTVDTCKRIAQSCKELAETIAEEDEPFEDLEDLARDTGERAHEVLTDDYKIQS